MMSLPAGMLDVGALAREIARHLTPESLLTAEDIAVLIGCTPRYFRECFSTAPGFPAALHLTGVTGRRGNPRWRRCDVLLWINSHEGGKSKLGGRPRSRKGTHEELC